MISKPSLVLDCSDPVSHHSRHKIMLCCLTLIQEPKRQLTMTTQPTDLDAETIQQIQKPGSPKQTASHDNAKKTDAKENEVQEKDEKKNEEKKEENFYEVIVEKAA